MKRKAWFPQEIIDGEAVSSNSFSLGRRLAGEGCASGKETDRGLDETEAIQKRMNTVCHRVHGEEAWQIERRIESNCGSAGWEEPVHDVAA